MIAPKDIINKVFNKSAFGGYRVDEVHEYLAGLAESFSIILGERNDLELNLQDAMVELENHRKKEGSLGTVLLDAQRFADDIVKDAETRAGMVVRDAQIKSDKAIRDSEEVIEKKNSELIHIQKKMGEFKNDMLARYKSHIELIVEIPDMNSDGSYLASGLENKNILSSENEPEKKETKQPEVAADKNRDNRPEPKENQNQNQNSQNNKNMINDSMVKKAKPVEIKPEKKKDPVIKGFVPNLEPREEKIAKTEVKSPPVKAEPSIPKEIPEPETVIAYAEQLEIGNERAVQAEMTDEFHVKNQGRSQLGQFSETGVVSVDKGEFEDIEHSLMYGMEELEEMPVLGGVRRNPADSRFGELRFGDDYDMDRDDEKRTSMNKKRKRR